MGVELPKDRAEIADKQQIVRLAALIGPKCSVTWDATTRIAHVSTSQGSLAVKAGDKSVTISLAEQMLVGAQGSVVVIRTNVSTGRIPGSTPRGTWPARSRSRIHYSSLYNNSPMPYSIGFTKNIFLHGYAEVPPYPASHGCVRLPVAAAKSLYDWIDVGTPIKIQSEKLIGSGV